MANTAPSGRSGPADPATTKVAQPYFIDQRKGEVNELRQLLRNINVERDPKRKRDIIKKVIAYMTLGIDVSRLFTEMILAIETKDLVVKKMVYLYLCNYAHQKPDMAIMAINTLLRDCSNEDPMVRGLALRSLSSLRLPDVVDYVMEPLKRSLSDAAGYVRQAAVVGVLKLHRLAPGALAAQGGFVEALYGLLRDPEPQVVTNCLCVLNEMLGAGAGLARNRAVVLHLLRRLGDFDEWGLAQILSLVAGYAPADDAERFGLMNLLDPVLRTANAGVALAAVRCFLALTEGAADLRPQVYERVRAPLLTLAAGAGPELAWCLLRHVGALVDKAPGVFDADYRLFYTRYDEPAPVKQVKIGLLAKVANAATMGEIAAELGEHVADVDARLARRALRAIGRIAERLPEGAPQLVEKLLEFLELDTDYVRSETVLVLKDLLRKYPGRRGDVLPYLHQCLRRIEDPQGKAAVIWMVGEYGAELVEAPYMLEPLIDRYEEEPSGEVRLALLVATAKLFFQRAPEVQRMLGRLLAAALRDASCQDLHDRALLYYRLLRANPEIAKQVIASNIQPVAHFAEEIDTGFKEKIFKEFNSLSILYDKTEEQYIAPEYQVQQSKDNDDRSDDGDNSSNEQPQNGTLAPAGPNAANTPIAHQQDMLDSAPPAVAPLEASMDLLGFDDDGPASAAPPPPPPPLALVEGAAVSGEEFQTLWGRLPDGCSKEYVLEPLPTQAMFEERLQSHKIYTMASGDLPDMMKFFFFAKDTSGQTFLVQCIAQKQNSTVNIVVKTTSEVAQAAQHLADVFIIALRS